jgi:hypothetical protein
MNIQKIRLKVLTSLIGEQSQKSFSSQYDLNASHLSQMLSGYRAIGEKAARTLEKKIGLPPYALDIDPSAQPSASESVLADDERALLTLYRSLSAAERKLAMRLIAVLKADPETI